MLAMELFMLNVNHLSENESTLFSKSDSTTQHVRTKANKSGLYACHQTVPSLEVKSSDHE